MKYLRPTDDFCMLKSWSAAKKEFARNGYYGKIVLGLTLLTRTEPLPKLFIGPKPPEQLRVVQWVCYAGTFGKITIPAFYHEESYAPYGDIRLLCEIPAGTTFVYDEEIFCFEHETVEIDGQKLEDWTIFSLTYIDNEEMAKFVAMVWGEKPLSATLNKCTIINDGRLNTEFSKCETTLFRSGKSDAKPTNSVCWLPLPTITCCLACMTSIRSTGSLSRPAKAFCATKSITSFRIRLTKATVLRKGCPFPSAKNRLPDRDAVLRFSISDFPDSKLPAPAAQNARPYGLARHQTRFHRRRVRRPASGSNPSGWQNGCR